MELITELIPQQGFEKALYKTALVLFTELTAQKDTHNNMPDFSVFVERMTPYDKSEGVMINVTTNAINYGQYTERDSQGKTDFNIQVYSPLEHTYIDANDDTKTFTLHKVIGLIRYILQSTRYLRLDLPAGLIGGTYVENIQFFDDFNNQDGANIRMANMVFSVRVQENQELWAGVTLFNNTSQIKLDDTDLGYKVISNN